MALGPCRRQALERVEAVDQRARRARFRSYSDRVAPKDAEFEPQAVLWRRLMTHEVLEESHGRVRSAARPQTLSPGLRPRLGKHRRLHQSERPCASFHGLEEALTERFVGHGGAVLVPAARAVFPHYHSGARRPDKKG